MSNKNPFLNWHHPTKVYFGKSVLLQLSKLIEENFPLIKNILIVTGKYHLKSNEYFNNSISNLNSLNVEIYDKIDPDIIIHLAAVSHANKSNKDPHNTFDHSLRTLENTLDFAKNKKKHVIYLSSSMVYGNFDGKEVDENTICNPIGIYGTLKLSGELLVKAYNNVFDLPYTIIRPSALYGERCVSRRVGQIFIENAIQNLDININGSGDETLDFTYIEDLIQGIYKSCVKRNSINQTFNITYGNSRKLSELAELVQSEFPNIKINYIGREKFMPERGTLNVNKARKIIRF